MNENVNTESAESNIKVFIFVKKYRMKILL